MRYFLLLGVSACLLSACSHWQNSAANKYKVPSNYKEIINAKVGAELVAESNSKRAPAGESWQLQSLKTQLGDFNRIRPGKFEIYVFPKMQTTNRKEVGDKEVLLGKPRIAEVSVLAVTTCDAFILKKAFAKYSPSKYFDAQLAKEKSDKCAIINVTSRSMRDANKALLREGDVLAKRIYLDSQYNVYGIETDLYSREEGKEALSLKTVGIKLDDGTPSTSGFDFLPVDMPALAQIQQMDSVDFKTLFAVTSKPTDFSFQADGTLVDRMALRQIGRLNKNFRIPSCPMKKMAYKDHFRKRVEMYWCEGLPWPQLVNSQQFIAVTQNLSVR